MLDRCATKLYLSIHGALGSSVRLKRYLVRGGVTKSAKLSYSGPNSPYLRAPIGASQK